MFISPPHLLDFQRWKNRRVGLLGGSFNPPHKGHLHASVQALNTLNLDFVWWLVTPQNPLKSKSILMDYQKRLKLCRSFVKHPKIIVTDIENQIGQSYSYYTLKKLQTYFSGTEFVWITGMDNATNFHKWYRWRDILQMIPLTHVARPPVDRLVKNTPLLMQKTQKHTYMQSRCNKRLSPNQSYWIKQRKMLDISSTAIRKKMGLKA